MYDHSRIASYRRWCVGNVGKRVQLLALDGRNAELAGGFPSNPILSGPRRTVLLVEHFCICLLIPKQQIGKGRGGGGEGSGES